MSKPKIISQLNGEETSKILLASDPTVNMEASTKQYIDNLLQSYATQTWVQSQIDAIAIYDVSVS